MESSHGAELMLQSLKHTLRPGGRCNRVCSYETAPICNGSRSAFSSAVCHLVIGQQAG